MKPVRRLAVLAVVAALVVAATAATSQAAKKPAKGLDLSGVTLHVGDQQSDSKLQLILRGSGEEAKAPYTIDWTVSQNGPVMIAAMTGGSVDVGKMSETPLVFAQAAGSPVRVVYAAKPADRATSSLAIVVNKDSKLKKIADLKGKKVGYSPGTVLQYLLANALDSVGLKLSDVQLVTATPGVDLLASGDADAILSGDPSMSTNLEAGSTRILASGAKYTPGFHYLVARKGALDDPKLSAAIGDFVKRVARAEKWFNEHPAAAAKLVATQSKLPVPVAKVVNTRAPLSYGPITPDVIAAQQEEADFFFAQGTIKAKLDAKALFDTRYGTTTEP